MSEQLGIDKKPLTKMLGKEVQQWIKDINDLLIKIDESGSDFAWKKEDSWKNLHLVIPSRGRRVVKLFNHEFKSGRIKDLLGELEDISNLPNTYIRKRWEQHKTNEKGLGRWEQHNKCDRY